MPWQEGVDLETQIFYYEFVASQMTVSSSLYVHMQAHIHPQMTETYTHTHTHTYV